MLCRNREIVRKGPGRPGEQRFWSRWAIEKVSREEYLLGGGVTGGVGVHNSTIVIITIVIRIGTIVDNDIVL